MQLTGDWAKRLGPEMSKEYMQTLQAFIAAQRAQGIEIYPEQADCFRAFELTPFHQVKVVILGQDPYHGPGQAHGLSFSVRPGVKVPPSLLNIYKEISQDLAIPMAKHGDLSHWAQQGVLLLNSVLTVEQAKANSHQGKGWETFTDEVIAQLNQETSHLVFMLWGSYAQKKGKAIDRSKHLVLEAVHPSPLSAYRGFLGCQHFSKANQYLVSHGIEAIDWSVPESAPQTGETLQLF